MFTIENQVIISTEWNNRFVNQLVDTLQRSASSSIYIATGDNSRKIAMKSLIGLLSGGFKKGDEVKIIVIGDNEHNVSRDLKLVEDMLKGEND